MDETEHHNCIALMNTHAYAHVTCRKPVLIQLQSSNTIEF